MSTQSVVNSFNQYAYNTANSFGGLDSNPNGQISHNDQYDAYRHALMSAYLTSLVGPYLSKELMDKYEDAHPNDSLERNMDEWNNSVGREAYFEWIKETGFGMTGVSLEEWVYQKVKDGETINDPGEEREYKGSKSWYEGIGDEVNNWFQNAFNFIPPSDPLTLDLDGDGIETLAADGTVIFDHDGDGIKNGTGWISGDDGILVLDKNNNGLIDNGNELFGDNTIKSDGTKATDGFDALSDLDTNNDGLVDASDAVNTISNTFFQFMNLTNSNEKWEKPHRLDI